MKHYTKRKPINPMNSQAGRMAHVRFCHATGMMIPGEIPPNVIKLVNHDPEVFSSVRRIMSISGIDNPDAYFARWTLEEILPELTEIIVTVNNDDRHLIKSPGGILWARLEYTYPGRSPS